MWIGPLRIGSSSWTTWASKPTPAISKKQLAIGPAGIERADVKVLDRRR